MLFFQGAFLSVATLNESTDRMLRTDVIAAHGGGPAVFEGLETIKIETSKGLPEDTDEIDLSRWLSWLQDTHEAKTASAGVYVADKWMRLMLSSVQDGAEMMTSRGRGNPQGAHLLEAEEIFILVSYLNEGLEGSLSHPPHASRVMLKEDLLQAHGGDVEVYSKLDPRRQGCVELQDWISFCDEAQTGQGETFRSKEVGKRYLRQLFHTLRTGAHRLDPVFADAVEVFRSVASVYVGGHGAYGELHLMTKDEMRYAFGPTMPNTMSEAIADIRTRSTLTKLRL